jgi:Tfp pilus assembly protein PilF
MKLHPIFPRWWPLWLPGLTLLFGAIAALALLKLPTKLPLSPPAQKPAQKPVQPSLVSEPALQREVEFYQAQLQRDPNSGLALAHLAQAYWKTGKATLDDSWYLLAEQTAMRSLSALPFDNTGAQLTLAQVAQARHDFNQAQAIAAPILKAQPKNEDARTLLVTTHLALGDLKAADALVQPLVNRMPSLEHLTLLGLVQAAQGKPEARRTLELAITTEQVGEERASAWARVLLGQQFYQRGQMDRAAALYQEALQFAPNYPLALLHLAVLETRRGHYDKGDRLYDQVLGSQVLERQVLERQVLERSGPYASTALRGKARLQQLRRQPHIALLNQAEGLLRGKADSFGHRRELAQLLLDRNQNQDNTEALQLMQAEIQQRRDAQTLTVYARSLAQSDRLVEAKAAIAEALGSGQKTAGRLLLAAQIEQRLGNPAQASQYREQAKQIDPSFDATAEQILGLDTL